MSPLKRPPPVPGRPGEGSANMTKQLALQHAPGKGATVKGDEGALAALTQVMHRPGGQLLARAGLSLYQHRDSGRGCQL